MKGVPFLPLAATLFVQALCTMAAYSMSVAAPAVAADLGVPGATIGLYTSLVYGFGMISAIGSPAYIHRYGAIRISQYSLATAIAGLTVAAVGGTLVFVALSAFVIGMGYGATAPASSHLLVQRTPARMMNLVLSIRQTGVPLGGVLAGLLVPPLILAADWRTALLAQIVPCALLIALLQPLRRAYDVGSVSGTQRPKAGRLASFALFGEMRELRLLSVAALVYSGAQLCFGAFMVVYLTGRLGVPLVSAGLALAVFQVAGVLSRIVWGWLADRFVSARLLLGLHGAGMAAAALLTGAFDAGWPFVAILAVAALAGSTASGFTGLAVAEFARIAGRERAAEATGLGAFAMFFGVMLLPAGFSAIVTATGSYAGAYAIVAGLAGLSGLLLLAPRGYHRG